VAAITDVGIADAAAESRLAGAWREFAESRTAVVALAVVVLLIGIALIAPLVVPQNPYDLTQLSIMDSCRRSRAGSTACSICSAPTTRAATCSPRFSTACG